MRTINVSELCYSAAPVVRGQVVWVVYDWAITQARLEDENVHVAGKSRPYLIIRVPTGTNGDKLYTGFPVLTYHGDEMISDEYAERSVFFYDPWNVLRRIDVSQVQSIEDYQIHSRHWMDDENRDFVTYTLSDEIRTEVNVKATKCLGFTAEIQAEIHHLRMDLDAMTQKYLEDLVTVQENMERQTAQQTRLMLNRLLAAHYSIHKPDGEVTDDLDALTSMLVSMPEPDTIFGTYTIDEDTLHMIDSGIQNMKDGNVGDPIKFDDEEPVTRKEELLRKASAYLGRKVVLPLRNGKNISWKYDIQAQHDFYDMFAPGSGGLTTDELVELYGMNKSGIQQKRSQIKRELGK